MNDYFQSYTISLILAWMFSILIIVRLMPVMIGVLFEKSAGMPRSLMIWQSICLLLFSPLRYILLQLVLATSYPVQSFLALSSFFLLLLYIPIVFSILYAIGLGLPLLTAIVVEMLNNKSSKIRVWLSAVASLFVCILARWIFFIVLPYAAYSTHWLNPQDVIRATNGPAEYFYRYVAEPMNPLQFPEHVRELGIQNLTARERLRAHVAELYLGEKAFSVFMHKSYPEEFKGKTGYGE